MCPLRRLKETPEDWKSSVPTKVAERVTREVVILLKFFHEPSVGKYMHFMITVVASRSVSIHQQASPIFSGNLPHFTQSLDASCTFFSPFCHQTEFSTDYCCCNSEYIIFSQVFT